MSVRWKSEEAAIVSGAHCAPYLPDNGYFTGNDVISIPVTSELFILPKSGHGSAVSCAIYLGRDTAVPCPRLSFRLRRI